MRRLKRRALPSLLFALILGGPIGCASSPIATDSFCAIAAEIGAPLTYSSSKDTVETRDGIDRFNAAWLTHCKGEMPTG